MPRFDHPIHPSMEVDTSDGKRIGKVIHVWERAATPSLADPTTSPTTSAPGWPADEEGYLKVHHGLPGFLGQDLYIPFSAVEQVLPSVVILNLTREQLAQKGWNVRPDFLPVRV